MAAVKFISKLLKVEDVNESTKILHFSSPENFEFRAGQYVMIAFYSDGKRILRSYSIFSSPYEKDEISFYLKKVEGGYASNFLFNMNVGDEIEVKGPLGNFVIEESSKNIFFISTGTGFAPFMSMIEELFQKKFSGKIILIRGHRREEDLVCNERLKKISSHLNFEIYNVLSKSENKNYEFKGHVQDFLEEIVPPNFNGDFYICGLKEMIFHVLEKLHSLGISDGQIFFERYD